MLKTCYLARSFHFLLTFFYTLFFIRFLCNFFFGGGVEGGGGEGGGVGGLDPSVANPPPHYSQLKSQFYRI